MSSACAIARTCSRSRSTPSASMAYGDARSIAAAGRSRCTAEGHAAKLENTFEVRLFSFAQTTTPIDSLDVDAAARPADAHRRFARPGPADRRQRAARRHRAVQRRRGERRLAERRTRWPRSPRTVCRFTPSASARSRSTIWSSSGSMSRRARRPVRPSARSRHSSRRRRSNAAAGLRSRQRWSPRATSSCRRDATAHDRDHRPAGRRGGHARSALRARSAARRAQRRSTTRVRTSSMCRRPDAISCTSKASRAGNTNSCVVRRSAIALRVASVVRTTPNKYYRQGVDSARSWSRGFRSRRPSCLPTTPSSSAATKLPACGPSSIGCSESSSISAAARC